MKPSEIKILELRIELGIERLVDMSSNYGKSNRRVKNYRKRLDKLINQLNQEKHSNAS